MKTIMIKVVLIGCLFVSMFAKAQNPFITKADIIAQFDISPNSQQLCCKWWGADAMFKFRIMDLSTRKVQDIDSISARKTAALYFSDGVSFLSDNLLLIGKDKAILSYDIKRHEYSKLFNLSTLWSNTPRTLAVAKDKKGVYLLDENIYYADLRTGIQDSVCLGQEAFVVDISATANNQVIYGIREKDEKGNRMYQIWIWNGQEPPVNLTEQFSKVLKVPYLVEATSNPDLYIVANLEGVYRFDKHIQKATKLVDNPEEDLVIRMRVSDDNQTIYYLTVNHRAVVKTMDMNGKQGESISF